MPAIALSLLDTFAGANGADLSTHTPDTGSAWVKESAYGSGGAFTLNGSGAFINSSGTPAGYINGTVQSADGWTSVEFTPTGSNTGNGIYLLCRHDSTGNQNYNYIRWIGGSTHNVVAGTATSGIQTPGVTKALASGFAIRGLALKLVGTKGYAYYKSATGMWFYAGTFTCGSKTGRRVAIYMETGAFIVTRVQSGDSTLTGPWAQNTGWEPNVDDPAAANDLTLHVNPEADMLRAAIDGIAMPSDPNTSNALWSSYTVDTGYTKFTRHGFKRATQVAADVMTYPLIGVMGADTFSAGCYFKLTQNLASSAQATANVLFSIQTQAIGKQLLQVDVTPAGLVTLTVRMTDVGANSSATYQLPDLWLSGEEHTAWVTRFPDPLDGTSSPVFLLIDGIVVAQVAATSNANGEDIDSVLFSGIFLLGAQTSGTQNDCMTMHSLCFYRRSRTPGTAAPSAQTSTVTVDTSTATGITVPSAYPGYLKAGWPTPSRWASYKSERRDGLIVCTNPQVSQINGRYIASPNSTGYWYNPGYLYAYLDNLVTRGITSAVFEMWGCPAFLAGDGTGNPWDPQTNAYNRTLFPGQYDLSVEPVGALQAPNVAGNKTAGNTELQKLCRDLATLVKNYLASKSWTGTIYWGAINEQLNSYVDGTLADYIATCAAIKAGIRQADASAIICGPSTVSTSKAEAVTLITAMQTASYKVDVWEFHEYDEPVNSHQGIKARLQAAITQVGYNPFSNGTIRLMMGEGQVINGGAPLGPFPGETVLNTNLDKIDDTTVPQTWPFSAALELQADIERVRIGVELGIHPGRFRENPTTYSFNCNGLLWPLYYKTASTVGTPGTTTNTMYYPMYHRGEFLQSVAGKPEVAITSRDTAPGIGDYTVYDPADPGPITLLSNARYFNDAQGTHTHTKNYGVAWANQSVKCTVVNASHGSPAHLGAFPNPALATGPLTEYVTTDDAGSVTVTLLPGEMRRMEVGVEEIVASAASDPANIFGLARILGSRRPLPRLLAALRETGTPE